MNVGPGVAWPGVSNRLVRIDNCARLSLKKPWDAFNKDQSSADLSLKVLKGRAQSLGGPADKVCMDAGGCNDATCCKPTCVTYTCQEDGFVNTGQGLFLAWTFGTDIWVKVRLREVFLVRCACRTTREGLLGRSRLHRCHMLYAHMQHLQMQQAWI